jgi:SPP1 gp7 family putative phage head morphogenesis protein
MPEVEDKTQAQEMPQASSARNLMADVYTGSAEETFFKSPMVADSYLMPYNSDEIWQKTGDYRIYEDMVQDDQVSICLQLKKDLILGSGYELMSEEDDQEDMIKELRVALDDSDSPFLESIEEILTAYDFGFSLTEKIFKTGEDGKLQLGCLKTRHPNSWLIFQDDKGNVSKYEQNTVKGKIDINPKALIHFVNNKRFQNPYGTSDLRSAYNAWFAKRQVIRYFAIFLEKAASPIPVGRYEKNAPPGTAASLLDILKKFQTKTAIAIPKEVEVEFLEAKSNGEAYSKAINIFNMFIGRSLFIPDLLGMSGSETSGGSYSMGKEQIGLFFMHINRRRSAIEQLINNHLIKPLVLFNYGFVENFPKFKFKPLDDGQATELAKTWLEAVKGKVFTPNEEEINYFRRMVKFPEGEVEIPEPAPSPFGGANPGTNGKDMPMPGKEMPNKMDDGDSEKETSKKQTFAKVYDFPSGDYHKKVNFKAIETKLNDYDQSVLSEAQPLLKKVFADLYDQLQRKKIVSDMKVERIDSIKLKHMAELKKILKSSFMGIYKDAQNQASQEIFKSNFRAPTTSEEFLRILEEESFQFIGDWSYVILKRARLELIAAIKDGRPLSSVLDILDEDGKKLAQESLERYARTKHTEVMNRGRHEFFESSGVVSGYQYSAIMDDRTSEICRGLHGKKFKAGDEPIPPMHFNCRSLLIPITKFEEFEPSETVGKVPINDFIDENVGTGFSIK